MSKMDGVSPRKPADLEYKYNFGKSFAEVYNLIADVQKGTESAVNELDAKLDPEEIFNRLTNYGKVQGIYRGDNGDIYVNATYIKSGKLAAEYIDADNLKVQAANITGELTIGQLPGDLASKNDIPTKLSALANDVDFQTPSGVTTIVGGMITTDYVEALGIEVKAAKITGKLTADQIDATNLKVAAANVTGTLTASQIDATSLKVSAANITGTLTASQIDATSLKVSAANITGTLAIGQLPTSVAETSDIPTKLSAFLNDTDYKDGSGVTSIVGGVVTTEFVEALGIEVKAAKITGQLTANQIDATNLKVAAANVTGTLTASQIDATNLKVAAANITGTLQASQLVLTGAITFDDLTPGLQTQVSATGISAQQATTLITSTLVSSPTIRGGSFEDLSGSTKLTLDPTSGGFADLHLTNKNGTVAFSVTDNIGSATINLYGMRVLTAGIMATYPLGTWDFSNTEVIGISAVFG